MADSEAPYRVTTMLRSFSARFSPQKEIPAAAPQDSPAADAGDGEAPEAVWNATIDASPVAAPSALIEEATVTQDAEPQVLAEVRISTDVALLPCSPSAASVPFRQCLEALIPIYGVRLPAVQPTPAVLQNYYCSTRGPSIRSFSPLL